MKPISSQRGVAMVEAIIAVIILAVGVIGALTLQLKSTAAMSDARSRAEATLAAEELLGMIWNDQGNAASYTTGQPGLTNWNSRLKSNIPGASATVQIVNLPVALDGSQQQQVTITINWKRRANDDQSTHKVVAYLEPAR
jgi:type IV pilus assembly protein PilV